MGTRAGPLGARKVEVLKEPGQYADGAGLYLRLDQSGSKRWVYIFQWRGKRKEMGLGSYPAVRLADARTRRDEARKVLLSGRNPIMVRREADARNKTITLGSFAEALIDDLEQGWRNPKHRQQWRNTLRTYAASVWTKPINEVTTDDVLAILKPIWTSKSETASRVRGRLERVLDAAKAKGLRQGENPARLKGHLDALLPKRPRLTRGHHPAMPHADLPSFMRALRERQGASPRALEFTIATAARESEVLNATWAEVGDDGVWTIPASRMKAGVDHRVPLNAVAVAAAGERQGPNDYLFPGLKAGRPLSNAAMDAVLDRMGLGHLTVHGFRSSFADWAADETSFDFEVREAALAHKVGNKVSQAYRRGDALQRRRELMAAWSDYLASEPPVEAKKDAA